LCQPSSLSRVFLEWPFSMITFRIPAVKPSNRSASCRSPSALPTNRASLCLSSGHVSCRDFKNPVPTWSMSPLARRPLQKGTVTVVFFFFLCFWPRTLHCTQDRVRGRFTFPPIFQPFSSPQTPWPGHGFTCHVQSIVFRPKRGVPHQSHFSGWRHPFHKFARCTTFGLLRGTARAVALGRGHVEAIFFPLASADDGKR